MTEYDIKKMQAYLADAAKVVRCGTLTDAAVEKMKTECKVAAPAPAYFVLGFYDAFDGWSIFDVEPGMDKDDLVVLALGVKRYKTRADAQAVCDVKNAGLGQNNKNMGERWQVFTDAEARRYK